MQGLRPPPALPLFRPWVTGLCLLLTVAGGVGLLQLLPLEEPDNEPLRIYIESLLDARDEFPQRPAWQHWLTGETRFENYEKEIVAQFERGVGPDDPLFNVQYAITLLVFGREDEVAEVLSGIEAEEYEETIAVLEWLADPDKGGADSEIVAHVDWLTDFNNSWWSRNLRGLLADAGLLVAAPESDAAKDLWDRMLVVSGLDWMMLLLWIGCAAGLWRYRHTQIYGGIASCYGAQAGNGELLAALLRMVVAFSLLSVMGYGIAFLFDEDPEYWVFAQVELVSRLVPAALFILWFFPGWRAARRALGLELRHLSRASTWFYVCAGLAVSSLAAWILYFAADLLGGVNPADFVHVDLVTGGWDVLVFQLFTAGVLAAVSEEVIFRGVVFRSLATRYGAVAGALVSSAVFAAIHFYSPLGMASVFISGLVFAWVTHRTGSLWPALIVHAVGNVIATATVWWTFG